MRLNLIARLLIYAPFVYMLYINKSSLEYLNVNKFAKRKPNENMGSGDKHNGCTSENKNKDE